MELTHLTVPQWQKYDGLLHGFMGRRGGKSVGRYAGLNVSYRVGDDTKVVSQNVCDMKLAIGIHDGKIVTMRQVHGDNIIEVTDKKIKEAGEADGMVTAESGHLSRRADRRLRAAPLHRAQSNDWRRRCTPAGAARLAGIASEDRRLLQEPIRCCRR